MKKENENRGEQLTKSSTENMEKRVFNFTKHGIIVKAYDEKEAKELLEKELKKKNAEPVEKS